MISMKLYATVSSERASKGQGGEYLDIVILGEDKKPIMDIAVRSEDERYTIHGYVMQPEHAPGRRSEQYFAYEVGKRNIEAEKGKQQKGEHKLTIKSLHDAMADCTCGWHYAATGARTRAEIEEEYRKHL